MQKKARIMCGIICSIYSDTDTSNQVRVIQESIQNRGPDYLGSETVELTTTWNSYLMASVLHTQGAQLTKQPIISSKNNILLWNGDIFNGPIISEKSEAVSDTNALFEWIEKNDHDIPKSLTSIEGPYSFIYFNNEKKELWIGRDPLGRHSLLWKLSIDSLLIASVGHKSVEMQEVPAVGIFCLHLSGNSLTDMCLYRWSHVEKFLSSCESELPTFLKVNDETIDYFDFGSERSSVEKVPFFPETFSCDDKLLIMDTLLKDDQVRYCVKQLLDFLIDSCGKRLTMRKSVCTNCTSEADCLTEHARVGILFSGGLDSTIIAYIANKFVPDKEPIDLINVAFSRKGNFDVPDRKTAVSSLQELSTLCPERIWNLVQVNVSDAELKEARQNRVCHLIHPLRTVLDDSLGCALWFTCCARGLLRGQSYTSSAKIVLLGSGADEQFGGYTRHRNLLKRNGWQALDEQLLKETLEISSRNLGRDDRVACDSGRQPRFPFLDEKLVKYVASLPAWQKCGPTSYAPGLGDKLLLRLAAVELGLRKCAVFPKRAFQFGCRIANSKEKGNVTCDRL